MTKVKLFIYISVIATMQGCQSPLTNFFTIDIISVFLDLFGPSWLSVYDLTPEHLPGASASILSLMAGKVTSGCILDFH